LEVRMPGTARGSSPSCRRSVPEAVLACCSLSYAHTADGRRSSSVPNPRYHERALQVRSRDLGDRLKPRLFYRI
jgi:hypothetical protein